MKTEIQSTKLDSYNTFMQLAKKCHAEGLCYRAEDFCKQAIAIARDLNESEPNLLTESLYELACYYDFQGKADQAESLWIELKTHETYFSSDSYIYVDTVFHLADLSEKNQAFDIAEVLYKKLLKKQEAEFGDESLAICPAIEKLAAFYCRQNKYALAETLSLRVLVIKEFYLGTCSPEINYTVNSLIDIFQNLNKIRLAEYMMNRQKAILLALHGKDSICVATCALRLAELQINTKQFNRAIDNLSYAIHVYKNQFGERSAVVKSLQDKLDTLLIYGMELSSSVVFNTDPAEGISNTAIKYETNNFVPALSTLVTV